MAAQVLSFPPLAAAWPSLCPSLWVQGLTACLPSFDPEAEWSPNPCCAPVKLSNVGWEGGMDGEKTGK